MAKQADYVRYTIRVPAELYARVQEAAGEKSVNAEVVERLERSFEGDSESQYWETYLKFLRTDQDHIENMYLTGKTDDLFPAEKVRSPAKMPPLLKKISDMVNRRTQLAMEIIVKELQRKGMLAADNLPTNEEWQELRAAPHEVQPDIFEALANLDVARALEVARGSKKYPAVFNFDEFFEEWIRPVDEAEDEILKSSLAKRADAALKAQRPKLSVWLSKIDGKVVVAVGLRYPHRASEEAAAQADEFLRTSTHR